MRNCNVFMSCPRYETIILEDTYS